MNPWRLVSHTVSLDHLLTSLIIIFSINVICPSYCFAQKDKCITTVKPGEKPFIDTESTTPDRGKSPTKLKILYLNIDQFCELNPRRKLVFQFHFKKFNDSEVGLVAYAAYGKRARVYDRLSKILSISQTYSTIKIPEGQVTFGDHKLIKSKLEAIKKHLKKFPKFKFLVFYPVWQSGYIKYNIRLSTAKDEKLTMQGESYGNFETNPSPPATSEFK